MMVYISHECHLAEQSLIALILSSLHLVCSMTTFSQEVLMEYCQWETFNATCSRGSVVVMQSARYGRMKHGRCADTDVYIGCSADVLSQMDERCSGRQSCVLAIPDSALHQQQPCPNDMMAYLEASFVCVQDVGMELARGSCSVHPDATVVSQSEGHLSSRSVSQSEHDCPWIIAVQPGKTIDLYVIDFTLTSRYHDVIVMSPDDAMPPPATGDGDYCHVYATVSELPGQGRGQGQTERQGHRDVKICAGNRREQRVYSSTSNSVSVQLSPLVFDDPAANFLLKYVARGCADVRAPRNGWVHRAGDRVTVTCNFTTHTWHLVCRDTHWVGQISACTEEPVTERRVVTYDQFPTYGLIFAVVVGVIIGAVSGFTLLTAILCCKRTVERRPYEADAGDKNSPAGDVELVSLRDSHHHQQLKLQHHCQHRQATDCYSNVWPVMTAATDNDQQYNASSSTQRRPFTRDDHVEHTYRSPLLDKDYDQYHHHHHHCIASPYHQTYSSDTTAILSSCHACAVNDEELGVAILLSDGHTTENHLNSQVTCSAADPDITRVQTAQV